MTFVTTTETRKRGFLFLTMSNMRVGLLSVTMKTEDRMGGGGGRRETRRRNTRFTFFSRGKDMRTAAPKADLRRLSADGGLPILEERKREERFVSSWSEDMRVELSLHHVIAFTVTVDESDGGWETERD